jgi:tetratricopeptide (TPR) repeat protein
MRALVTTLRSLLADGDRHHEQGQTARASVAYERLLQAAQERGDRQMETIAKAMLARVLVKRRDLDGAEAHLKDSEGKVAEYPAAEGRWRGSRARLIEATSPRDEAVAAFEEYLHWAQDRGVPDAVVDAATLLAGASAPERRMRWLRLAIDHATDHGLERPLGRLYTHLAALLDQAGDHEAALAAYETAVPWHRQSGSVRDVVGALWAAGAAACRAEDWPTGRTYLDQAVEDGQGTDHCLDLVALSLFDLARVYEAAGDPIEARRLVIRGMALARDESLPQFWPDRWASMLEYARHLELVV